MTTQKTPAPEATELVANILACYQAASPDQRADGMTWYDEAHALATELAATTDHDVLRAAGVIAAISPRMSWDLNERLARKAYADKGVTGGMLGVSVRKANAIYHGADVLTTLKAPKTQAFALCIAEPGHESAVVVDRHAMSIAYGRQVEDDEVAALSLKGRYDLFADAYRTVAAMVGLTPAQVQAITWVYWRETNLRVSRSIRLAAGRAA